MRCWRCQDKDEYDALGLCRDCRDWLYAEQLTVPGNTLLPLGTLPEQIGPYRPPTAADYKTSPQ